MRLLRAALCLLLALGPSARADAPPPTVDERMDRMIDQGLRAMYNLDYAATEATFKELSLLYPDHPIGLYGMTTSLWWELTNEHDESSDAMERKFLSMADQTLEATRRLMKAGDPSGVVRLCQGGTLGLKGRWDAIQGHWLTAYRNGKQAFDLQKEAIHQNPALYDAYLGPGIFHYYVAVLPAVVKMFAHMVFGGSKEQGLNEIRLAMTKGRFSKTAARLFLVNIYVNNEKDPDTALALLREGRAEYPESPFFHLIELLVLEEAKEWAALEAGARDFLEKIDAKAPYYRPQMKHRGLFSLANSRLGRGQVAEALALYDRVLGETDLDDRWITLTYLNRGKAYDLLGRREEALENYRTVMKRRDVWEVRDKAKAYLRRPYEQPGVTPPTPEVKTEVVPPPGETPPVKEAESVSPPDAALPAPEAPADIPADNKPPPEKEGAKP